MSPTRVRRFLEVIRTSYWFVPGVMSAAAIALALAAVELDHAMELSGRSWFVSRAGADGAREVLSTIAGSMITVAATVFSITIVALSLASQQYGPRLLRNFMRDTPNQVVLGTFTATFLYCLLVLRTIAGDQQGRFVPHVSVAIAVVLAVLSLGVLIFFIHHVAKSIQVEYVTDAVADELDEQIETLFPEQVGGEPPAEEPGPAPPPPDAFDRNAAAICFPRDGYLQTIDESVLLRVATERDLVVRLACRPGTYIYAGDRCAQAWPRDRVGDDAAAAIRDAFAVGPARNPIQDAEFAINQLVEVALRALSPALNDPFTALTCIDRLGSGLARLAGRRFPSPCRLDERGALRVIVAPFEFTRLARAAFDPIRQYDADHPMVAERLIRTIEHVAGFARREGDRGYLLAMAADIRAQHQERLRRADATPPRQPPPE